MQSFRLRQGFLFFLRFGFGIFSVRSASKWLHAYDFLFRQMLKCALTLQNFTKETNQSI